MIVDPGTDEEQIVRIAPPDVPDLARQSGAGETDQYSAEAEDQSAGKEQAQRQREPENMARQRRQFFAAADHGGRRQDPQRRIYGEQIVAPFERRQGVLYRIGSFLLTGA